MIEYKMGNILNEKAGALVNAVNCVMMDLRLDFSHQVLDHTVQHGRPGSFRQ